MVVPVNKLIFILNNNKIIYDTKCRLDVNIYIFLLYIVYIPINYIYVL